jgi:serine/threonine protein kinase/Flp pilus assembly protein TadD
MHSELWSRVAPLLDELIELTPEEREPRLEALDRNEPELAVELRRVLALDSDRPDFMATPVSQASIHASLPGMRVGPYRLLRMIGEGGMGQVWLAERADGLFERRVALKLLHPGFVSSGLRTRFDRERQILASLGHEHVARLLDAGLATDGQPYLALEYVEGQNITDYSIQRKLTVVQKLTLFLQVCSAVSHAHASLVVHRDLKPSNIMVTPGGAVRLLDFGIAKLIDPPGRDVTNETTRTGTRAFTLHYAAPEQIRGDQVTTGTDVYSLGVVLYELLTGRKPYRIKRDTDAEWEEAILSVEPIRPSVMTRGRSDLISRSERRLSRVLSGDLDNITLKALHKNPEDRYMSVEALAADLRRYLNGRPVEAHAKSYGYRFGKYIRRNAWSLALVVGVIALLGGALYVVTSKAREARAEAQRAQAMHDFVIGLFEQAGKEAGPSNSVDIRQLLDAGVRRTQTEFASQPIVRAELLALIARMHLRLGDYSQAIAVLNQQKSALFAAPSTVQIESLQLRGDALRQLGDPARCRDLLLAHEDELDESDATARRDSADYQSVLGRCERGLQNIAAARTHFQHALHLRELVGDAGEEQAESLEDLATLEADEGNSKVALNGLLGALQRLNATHNEHGPVAVSIWLELGSLYRQSGNSVAAENAYRTAERLAVDLYGSGHPTTIDAETRLAAIDVDQGKLDLAEPLFAEAERQFVRLYGPNYPELGSINNSLGIIAWERGDVAAAERRLRRAVQLWAQSPRLAGGLFDLAMILHAARRDSDAEPIAQRALTLRQKQLGPKHGLVGVSLRQLGEIKLAENETAAAEPLLLSAVAILSGAANFGASHTATGHAQLALAHLRVAQRRPDDAQVLIGDIERRFAPVDAQHRRLLWETRALAAQLQCVQPRNLMQGRSALLQIRNEINIEMPVSAIQRDTTVALQRCGG